MGFDRDKYLRIQSSHITERRAQPSGKLYLEFGGKLIDDMYASHVLPGFVPDNRIAVLVELVDEVGIVIAVNARHLASNEARVGLGTLYKDGLLHHIDALRSYGLYVGNAAVTQWTGDDRQAQGFKHRLEALDIAVYCHFPVPSYPGDVVHIVSTEGYGRNEHIETRRGLMVVTAPGPGSGKTATCLSQIYHGHQQGISSGYVKLRTFPVQNLSSDHPVNIAHEAVTADLDDVNMTDPFHLAAHGVRTVNYNRDIEAFPVLNRLFEEILDFLPYVSSTDMGVNMAGSRISDGEVCRQVACQETIRHYYRVLVTEKCEVIAPAQPQRIALPAVEAGVSKEDRPIVPPVLEVAKAAGEPVLAIKPPDGHIMMGKTSALLGYSSTMLLNVLKSLAGIGDDIDLLAPASIEPIQKLKIRRLGSRNPRLHTGEVLIALAVSVNGDDNARKALDQLETLQGCEVHTSMILSSIDKGIFRVLEIQVTNEPVYTTKPLYRKK